MDSQRIKFLTLGHLRGWLDFDYSQITSRLREDLIIRFLEADAFEDLIRHKLITDAALVGGLGGRSTEALTSVQNLYKHYTSLKLPSLQPKDTIVSKELSKEDLDNWKSVLANLNKPDGGTR